MKTLTPNGANHNRNRAVQLIFNNLKDGFQASDQHAAKRKARRNVTVGRAISDYVFFYYLCLTSKIVICSDISINFYFRSTEETFIHLFLFYWQHTAKEVP